VLPCCPLFSGWEQLSQNNISKKMLSLSLLSQLIVVCRTLPRSRSEIAPTTSGVDLCFVVGCVLFCCEQTFASSLCLFRDQKLLVSQGFQPCLQSLCTNLNENPSSEDAPLDENPKSDIGELVTHVTDLHHVFPSGFLWLPLVHWSSTGQHWSSTGDIRISFCVTDRTPTSGRGCDVKTTKRRSFSG